MRQSVSRSRCDSGSLYLWYDDYLLIYKFICEYFFLGSKSKATYDAINKFLSLLLFLCFPCSAPFSPSLKSEGAAFSGDTRSKSSATFVSTIFSAFFLARLAFIFDLHFVVSVGTGEPTPIQWNANVFEFNLTPIWKKLNSRVIFLFCWCRLALIYGSLLIYRRSFVMTKLRLFPNYSLRMMTLLWLNEFKRRDEEKRRENLDFKIHRRPGETIIFHEGWPRPCVHPIFVWNATHASSTHLINYKLAKTDCCRTEPRAHSISNFLNRGTRQKSNGRQRPNKQHVIFTIGCRTHTRWPTHSMSTAKLV